MDHTHEASAARLVAAARALRPFAPSWTLGLEEPQTARSMTHMTLELALSRPELVPLAQSMTRWAFQRRPLDAALATSATRLPSAIPEQALASRLAGNLESPAEAAAMKQLMDAGEAALVARYLLPNLCAPDTALAWLAATWNGLLRLPSQELPETMLKAAALGDDLAQLTDRLRAEWAMVHLSPQEALPMVEEVSREHFGLWRRYMLAELLLRMGERDAGMDKLEALWREMPWHPQLTLKLDTLLHPLPAPRSDLADTAILLYSWNKADLLRSTLENLLSSELGLAKIFFLDNGSTDHMPEVVRTAAKQFGDDRFQTVTLPVNVGAPAARNWLLSLPEVRARQWAAFLDDDVVLPENWLTTLTAAAEREALEGDGPVDVVGCRITSADAPRTLQSADYHLLPPDETNKTFANYPEKIMIFNNCANDFDLGLFSYNRPATSVSGCCHLISMDSVERHGGFDIRFSPTQFDDLERDLRLTAAGLRVHYAGELVIGHVQHSSLEKSQSLASIGHVFGNKIKLEGKFSMHETAAMQAANSQRLETDLARREDRLLAELS